MSLVERTRSITSVFTAAILVLLSACATVPAPERGVVDTETMNDDEGVVFGVLRPRYYDSSGRQMTGDAVPDLPYEVYFGTAESISVKRAFSGFTNSIPGNAQQPRTFFAMKLPAGDYSLFKLYRPRGRTTGAVPIDVRFTVARGKVAYIGSLQIDFRAARGLFGAEIDAAEVALEIVDDAPRAARTYRERNPRAGGAIVTSLMKIKQQ